MPIYEFECLSCGHRFDRLQRLADADPTDCPTCGAPQVKRAITAASFRLKGGGWYETDFKSDKDKKRNLVEASSSSGGGESASTGASSDSAKSEAPKTEAPKVDKPAAPATPSA